MTRTGVAVAVVVASVGLPGCREDDQVKGQPRPGGAEARRTPTQSGKAPTKPEFLRKADALCAEAKRQAGPISDAVAAKVASEDAAGVAAELRKGLPIADRLLGRMRALTPPNGDEAVVGRYLDVIARQRGRIRPLMEALEAEDISSIEALAAELGQGNERAQRLAQGYGFTKCGPVDLPTRRPSRP